MTQCPGCNRPLNPPFPLCSSCLSKWGKKEPTPIALWRCPECGEFSNGFPTNHRARCTKDARTSYAGMPFADDVDDNWTESEYGWWRK